ncbi:MAG: S66 peptidase family protein [Acholeplasma sp.]
MNNIIKKPKKLNIGDKVAIVSLSSGLLGEDDLKLQVDLGVRRLTYMGITPVFMPNATKGLAFIKDNPKERANDLKEAFRDDEIKGIICAIGGDDTYKTIPYLMADNEFKDLVKNNPKIFIGFSDTTNNHLMFNKIGLVTYYGLNFLSDICELSPVMLPYTEKSYQQFLMNEDTTTIQSSPLWYENRTTYDVMQLGVPLTEHKETKGYEVLHGKGQIEGIFWGGCLDSLYDIYTSTRYKDQRDVYEKYDLLPPQAFFKDKILFLETSEEKPEPKLFEQMLETLKNEGILENVLAVMVGKPYDEVHYDAYKKILKKVGKDLNLPIIYNVNVGHALPRAMLPLGLKGLIDFDKKTIEITEKLFEVEAE